jgi:hypothetical protein
LAISVVGDGQILVRPATWYLNIKASADVINQKTKQIKNEHQISNLDY